MADNQKQFDGFLTKIELVGADLTSLRKSRDANRDRIYAYWKDTLERARPVFDEQGSFAMDTVIRPISGDYDLDDGMYLQCIGDDPDAWPSTATVQGCISAAVEGKTKETPKKMKRCVRVPYQDGYHIDIPAYGKDSFGTVRVYKKGDAPTEFDESNPVALVKWFAECKTSHSDLRDLVRFFKAWRDYKGGVISKVKSVAMTILVAEQIKSNERYDQAVVDTARACENFIRYGGKITKPVSPRDDTSASWDDDDRKAIADAFKTLADRGTDAIAAETVRDGALIWSKQFGARFPVPEEDETKSSSRAYVTTTPPVVAGGSYA